MKTENCRANAVVRADYRILAGFEADIRVPEGYPKATLFYQKTVDAAARWSEEILGQKAKREYLLLPDLWAKARFLPYRFRLHGEPVFEDSEYFVVVCESILLHGNERTFRRSAQAWNKREQTVLPKDRVWRLFGRGKLPRQKGMWMDGCYPADGKMIIFQNSDSKSSFLERKLQIFIS